MARRKIRMQDAYDRMHDCMQPEVRLVWLQPYWYGQLQRRTSTCGEKTTRVVYDAAVCLALTIRCSHACKREGESYGEKNLRHMRLQYINTNAACVDDIVQG